MGGEEGGSEGVGTEHTNMVTLVVYIVLHYLNNQGVVLVNVVSPFKVDQFYDRNMAVRLFNS